MLLIHPPTSPLLSQLVEATGPAATGHCKEPWHAGWMLAGQGKPPTLLQRANPHKNLLCEYKSHPWSRVEEIGLLESGMNKGRWKNATFSFVAEAMSMDAADSTPNWTLKWWSHHDGTLYFIESNFSKKDKKKGKYSKLFYHL